MMKKTLLTGISSFGGLCLLLGYSFSAQAACPAGTSTVDFTWDGSGTGNEAVWNFNDSSNTYTINYTDTSGNPASVDITMTVRDPDGINIDADVRDAGNHHYDPQGGCVHYPDPLTTPGPDDWVGDGSITDPWDSDCRGEASTAVTGTRMAYGPGYLTWFIMSSEHTEETYFDFSFSRPAQVMDNFTISDIDAVGLEHTFNTVSNFEVPGNSFQDEVGFSASLNSTPVQTTIFNVGGALTTVGEIARSNYNINQNNNVSPNDALGTISARTDTPFDTFTIMYSNGQEDAQAEQNNANLYPWWSNTNGATNGASDSQAVRVSGFTFCMAEVASPPPVSSSACTTVTNTANVSANETDSNPANNTASTDVQVNCDNSQMDLRLVKRADKTEVSKGGNLTFTLELTNEGAADASNIQVTDQLPNGISYVSSSATLGSYDNNTGIWSIPALTTGTTATLTLDVTVD